MAFGAITQEGEQSVDFFGGSSTISVTLTGTVAKALLLGYYFTGAASATIDTSGYAKDVDLTDGTNNDAGIITAKTSAGGDQTLQFTSIAGDEAVMRFQEIEGDFEATPLDKTASTGLTTATSISTNTTAATLQADEFAAAMATARSTVLNAASMSNSFVNIAQDQTGAPPGTNSAKSIHHSSKILAATGTVETTFSSIENTAHLAGVATYKKEVVGGGLSIPVAYHHRQRNF